MISRSRLVLSVSLVVLLGVPGSAAAKKKPSEPEPTPDLVWPLPPQQPRIRLVGELRHNFDIEPRKKRSLFNRLIGEHDPNVLRVLRKPAGVATDSSGRILVADSGQAVVFVFDPERSKVSYLGLGQDISLRTPLDVAVDARDRIFVADAGLQSVVVYSSEGAVLGVISDSERLLNPAGLALDEARGRLYVVDSKGHRIVVVDTSSLELVGSFGERGEGLGRFNYPVGIAVDSGGSIYVSDTGSCTVQIFDPDYAPVSSFGEPGIGASQFTRPKQVAIDSEGHRYVVDAAFNNFQIFSRENRLLLFVGSAGARPGTFNLPFGIHIDEYDRIYVSDQLNGRLQIFQFLGGD